MPVILPAPVYNSRTGDVYELPAETIIAVDDFPVPAGFRREGTREASFMYSIGVYVEPIDEETAPCKYFCTCTLGFAAEALLFISAAFALYVYRQLMSSSCTWAQVCAGTMPAVCTAGTAGTCIQVCAGTDTGSGKDYRTGSGRFGKFGTRYNINICTGNFGKFGPTSIPASATSVSSVRHQYRYRQLP